MPILIKRVYDAPSPADGRRILVDRLWPRGLSREKAHIHQWAKEIAPSAELRKWFGHAPERWPEFQKRFQNELKEEEARNVLETIRSAAKLETVTLLFAAKDEARNNAVVLQHLMTRQGAKK